MIQYYDFISDNEIRPIVSIEIANPPLDILQRYGYQAKPLVILDEPLYNADTQYLVAKYRINGDVIEKYYDIMDIDNSIIP